MNTKFKVGDKVRILNCGGGQPEDMVGKVLPIYEIDSDDDLIIKHPIDGRIWFFSPERVEYATDTPINTSDACIAPRVFQGKFTMPDGTPGVVDVVLRGNTTQVTIIVDPQERYNASNISKQFFEGVAFCNPCDKFDINTGIKEACRKALDIQDSSYRMRGCYGWLENRVPNDYRRSIYSSIRKTMRSTK